MYSNGTNRHWLLKFFTVVCVVWTAQAANAVTLDDAIAFIAERVELYMADQGQQELFIETFTGPPSINAKRVEQGVRDKLESKSKVKVIADPLDASWKLVGNLAVDPDDATRFKITVRLLDKNGAELTSFPKEFNEGKGNEAGAGADIPKETKDAKGGGAGNVAQVEVNRASDAPVLASINADVQTPVEKIVGKAANAPLPENLDDAKRIEAKSAAKEAISTAFKKPQFFPQPNAPSQIRASAESKFSLEIRVSKSPNGPYTPITPRNRGGKAFIDLKEGDYFEVQVTNGNAFDCGVELLLDGINSMNFSENPAIKESGKWLIKKESSGTVTGWFVRNGAQGIKRFLITSEPDGVAAKLGRPQKIGSIQANFYMAYTEDSEVPMFVALGGNGKGSIGEGVPTDFVGKIEARLFDKGLPLACISVLHSNPDPPADLPPQ